MRRLPAALAALGMALAVTVPASAADWPEPPSWCDEGQAVRSGGGWLCVGSVDGTTDRIAGTDRYATAAAISQTFWEPGEATTVYLASGAVYADAVVAGASVDGPLLLVPAAGVPDVVLAEIQRLAPVDVVALGGPAAVTDAQLEAARAAGQ